MSSTCPLTPMGANNFERFENARTPQLTPGRGVLFYPAGSVCLRSPPSGWGFGPGLVRQPRPPCSRAVSSSRGRPDGRAKPLSEHTEKRSTTQNPDLRRLTYPKSQNPERSLLPDAHARGGPGYWQSKIRRVRFPVALEFIGMTGRLAKRNLPTCTISASVNITPFGEGGTILLGGYTISHNRPRDMQEGSVGSMVCGRTNCGFRLRRRPEDLGRAHT